MTRTTENECSKGLLTKRVGKRGTTNARRGPMGLDIQKSEKPPVARSDLWTDFRIGNLKVRVLHPGDPTERREGPMFKIMPELVKPKPKSAKAKATAEGRKIVAGNGQYVFPVAAPWSFRDTWGSPRSGGRTHKGVDIFSEIGQEVYAFTSGTIIALQDSDSYGKGVFLRGKDGYLYGFIHIDRVAPNISKGKKVKAGDLIAFSGRTGIRRSPAHTHFQAQTSSKQYVNPFPDLIGILGLTGYVRKGQKITSIAF